MDEKRNHVVGRRKLRFTAIIGLNINRKKKNVLLLLHLQCETSGEILKFYIIAKSDYFLLRRTPVNFFQLELGKLELNKHVYKLELGKFVFNYRIKVLPKIFNNYFLLLEQIHNYDIRNKCNQNYFLNTTRTNAGKCSIKFCGAKL